MLERKIAWISRIETRDDALEVVKVASFAFFFLAALQLVLYLAVHSTAALVVATVLAAGGGALFLHSRAAAALLFGLSCIEALATVATVFGAHPGMGSNVFVAGLMVWVSFRAVQATWALEQMPDEEEEEDDDRPRLAPERRTR